jgi:hypothetical protein
MLEIIKQQSPPKVMARCHNLEKPLYTCHELESMFHIGIDRIDISPTPDHSAVHHYRLENSKEQFKNGLDYYFSREENVEIFSQDCQSSQDTELEYISSVMVRCPQSSGMKNIEFRSNCILSGTEPRLKDMIDFSCKNIKSSYYLSEITYQEGAITATLVNSSVIIIFTVFFIGCLKMCAGKNRQPTPNAVRIPQLLTPKAIVVEAAPRHQKVKVTNQDNNVYHSLA